MAMRPIWKGSITFGLVNIPVNLYLAAKSERVSFHMLHAKDQGRIRYKRVCELDGEEVGWDEIVKGYEYARGEYVEITNEDLDSIDIGLQRAVDIVQFVDSEEIDPIYYDRPYYLEPVRGAERSYALLLEALRRSGKVGIARVVFREREYLCAVRPRGDAIGLDTMRFASEVRAATDLHLPSGEATRVEDSQIDLALLLIDRLAAPWEPERYEDRYQEAVSRLIERKLEGVELPKAAPAPRAGKVIDLAEVLRRSLEEAEAEEKPKRGERRAAAPAQAARTTKRASKSATKSGSNKSGTATKKSSAKRKA